MKLLLKTLGLLLLLFIGQTIFIPPANAQFSVDVQGFDTNGNVVATLDENTFDLNMTIRGLSPGTDYKICTLQTVGAFIDNFLEGDINAGNCDKLYSLEVMSSGTANIRLCPAAEGPGLISNKLYLKKTDDCDVNNDYFHARDYNYIIVRKWTDIIINKYQKILTSAVSIQFYEPKIVLTPQAPKPTDRITLTIGGIRRVLGKGDRNKYDLNISKDDKTIDDIDPPDLEVDSSGAGVVSFNPLTNGSYTLTIKGKWNPNFLKTYKIIISDEGGSISGSDLGPLGQNPCRDIDRDGDIECSSALGEIPIDPTGFAGKILAIATGLAGGIALIIMVIGSIKILMASGDPQKVANGRDMIIAAVAGLLFLIFSVLILRYLGSNLFGLFTVT